MLWDISLLNHWWYQRDFSSTVQAQLTYVLGKGLNLESYFRDGIGTLNPILGEVFGFLG